MTNKQAVLLMWTLRLVAWLHLAVRALPLPLQTMWRDKSPLGTRQRCAATAAGLQKWRPGDRGGQSLPSIQLCDGSAHCHSKPSCRRQPVTGWCQPVSLVPATQRSFTSEATFSTFDGGEKNCLCSVIFNTFFLFVSLQLSKFFFLPLFLFLIHQVNLTVVKIQIQFSSSNALLTSCKFNLTDLAGVKTNRWLWWIFMSCESVWPGAPSRSEKLRGYTFFLPLVKQEISSAALTRHSVHDDGVKGSRFKVCRITHTHTVVNVKNKYIESIRPSVTLLDRRFSLLFFFFFALKIN